FERGHGQRTGGPVLLDTTPVVARLAVPHPADRPRRRSSARRHHQCCEMDNEQTLTTSAPRRTLGPSRRFRVAVAIALLVAACSSGSSGKNASDGSTTSTSARDVTKQCPGDSLLVKQPLVTLRLGHGVPQDVASGLSTAMPCKSDITVKANGDAKL